MRILREERLNVGDSTINMRPNMEADSACEAPRHGSRAWTKVLVLAFTLLAAGGCAPQAAAPETRGAAASRPRYEVHFTAVRAKDHSPLASVSIPLRLGVKGTVSTGQRRATEDKPALPSFAATLTTTRTPGLYQLVTKIAIREAARNKKGKLKTSKRNQGALLPIRPGATEVASPDGDPIEVNVRVDHR